MAEHDYARNTEFEQQVCYLKSKLAVSKQKFIAGNIKSKLSEWKKITSDKWILETVQGAKIEFIDINEIESSNTSNHEKLLSDSEREKFRTEIQRLLSKKVVEPTELPVKGHVSSIFSSRK